MPGRFLLTIFFIGDIMEKIGGGVVAFIIEGTNLYDVHLTKTKLHIHYNGRHNVAEVVWDPHSNMSEIPTRVIKNLNIIPAIKYSTEIRGSQFSSTEYYEVGIGTKTNIDIDSVLVQQNKNNDKTGAKLIVARDIIDKGEYELFEDDARFIFYYPSKEQYIQLSNGVQYEQET